MNRIKITLLIYSIIAVVFCCQEGCVNCDGQTQICFACGDNYQLTLLGQCVPDIIANCRLYLNNYQCVRCLPTYELVNNNCRRDLSGCIQNISSTRCARCSSELTLNNGNCVGTLNCLDNSQPCTSCGIGFTLSNGICVANPENCMIVSKENGVCFQCQQDYRMVGYRCINNNITSRNCYLYDERGRCYLCKDGYTLVGGSCLVNNQVLGQIINAVTNNSSQVSSTLEQSNTNSNSNQLNSADNKNNQPITSTSTNISLTAILDKLNMQCSRFNNSICVECYPSYYLNNQNVCVQINPLCQSFNHTSKKCQACYGGYKLNSDFNCIVAPPTVTDPRCKSFKQGKCLECFSQFHLQGNICVANNPLCKEVFQNGSCKSCYDGYNIAGNECVRTSQPSKDLFCIRFQNDKCYTCANGYFVQNTTGKCIPVNLNCLGSDNDGRCTACLAGYMLLDGNCIVPINRCQEYARNGSCSQCQVGFYLTYGICYPKDITCSQYNSQGQCTGCIITYYLFKGKCIFPALGLDPLCTNYLNSYCTECQNGSYLNNFICLKIDSRCLNFDKKKSQCLECKKGFKPMGAECI